MKLLASDFDNTLYFHDGIRQTDIDAIHHFQKHGHLFGVCTGRDLKGIQRPSQPYQIDYDFYILLSGSLILDKNLNVIYEKTISTDIIEQVFECADHQNMSLLFQNKPYRSYKEPVSDFDVSSDYFTSFDIFHHQDASSFAIHFNQDELEKATYYAQKIRTQFGEFVEVHQNNNHLDITAKGCSKGHGIHIVQDYF